ncbi:MAG: hypothetical protein AB9856_09335 [Cellulosilyticaceae bacterium]
MDNTELSIAATVFAAKEDGSYSIPYKPEDVFTALKNTVPKIKGFRVKSISEMGLAIDVSTKMTWKSIGEKINISVMPSQAKDSILNIKSKCIYGLNDWGKNKDNIDNILSALQSELQNSNYKGVELDIPNDDPTEKLLKLKILLDNNVITAEEYANKKEELLRLL